MTEMTAEKMLASQHTFDRLYQEHGVEVSWAKHPTSTLTDRFIVGLLTQKPNKSYPVVLDLGCGEGGKAFYIARYGLQVKGFDTSSVAIDIATRNAAELDMDGQVMFVQRDVLELGPQEVGVADGVHDYQCINHIVKEYYPRVAALIASLVRPGGLFLTNAFNKNTVNFYGEDISQRENGEFVFKYNPNNSHHLGKESVDGMYCYFFTESDLIALYSPYFRIEEMIEVPHPLIDGRFHWEVLMTKR